MGLPVSKAQYEALAKAHGHVEPETPAVVKPPKPTDEYKSKWERLFADELDDWKRSGKIQWWKYERVPLVLAKGRKAVNGEKAKRGAKYTADFVALDSDGKFVFLEVKGFQREASAVRMKVAADNFPGVRFVLVRREKNDWVYADFGVN